MFDAINAIDPHDVSQAARKKVLIVNILSFVETLNRLEGGENYSTYTRKFPSHDAVGRLRPSLAEMLTRIRAHRSAKAQYHPIP